MRENLHVLLKKQLKDHFNGSNGKSEKFDQFIEEINSSYVQFERNFEKLESSLNKSAKETDEEIKKINKDLKNEIDERKRIENKLTENLARISRLNKYEAIISSITQSVHQSLELKDVLEYAVDSISKNVDSVKHVTIYLVEDDDAVMQAHRGFTKEYIKKASRIPSGKGLIWKTIREKKPLFVLDTKKDKVIGPAGRKMGIMSYISVPLFFENNPIGALALTSSIVDGFSEDDFRVTEIVAQQIQSAIDNANRLIQIYVKSRYESIISSIVQSVHKTIDLGEVLKSAVNALMSNIEQCSHVSIYLVENEMAVMKEFKGYEDQDEFLSVVGSIPKPKGFTWKTILEGKTVNCRDIDKDGAIGPAGRRTGSKSYICVPLIVDNKIEGTINLHSVSKNAFNDDDRKLLEDVSNQISVAISNAKKAEEVSNRNSYLEILNKISDVVHKTLNIKEVYKKALDEIISIENVDITGVYLVSSKTGDAVLQDHRNFPDEYLKRATNISEGIGLTWKIIKTGKIHHIEDVQNDPDLGPAGKKMGWHCVLGIPLTINNKVEGVMWFISYEIQKYPDEQVELFSSITKQLSVSLSKAELYEDLTKKNLYENIINSVTQSVHKSIYLEEVFDNSVDALSKNVESVKHAAIYMIDGKSAVMKAHRGFSKKYMEKAAVIPHGKGLVWKTILDKQARYIPDTEVDTVIGDAGVEMGIKSYLAVPIYDKENITGVQVITSSQKEAFDQDELILLENISKQIQSAIDNAQKAEALFKSEEHNRLLIDNVKDYAILMLDIDGFVESWNSGAQKLTGYEEAEIIGKEFDTFYFDDDIDKKIPSHNLQIASHENSSEHDVWIIKKDKTSFWANIIINALRDLDGDLIGYSVAMHDITEKKKAAEDLEAYAAKLERSNEELEQFAYVASHDLQEPLRMVGSYLGLLERRYEEALDQDAKDFIFYAVDGAKRMQILINDLLSYSRVSTRGKPFEVVDCKMLLEGVLKNLEIAINESGTEIVYENLPENIFVDTTQFSQLLQNLISNGIKFCKNGTPKITINVEDKNSDWQFSVIDNGIGIEPEYYERIFVIFQRLHGKTDYPGTGMGLAICKKIILRHEGKIWVESEPDQGSKFHFTLPKRGGYSSEQQSD